MSVVSQLWQTPVRHDQRTGTSQASASSSRLRVVAAPRDGEVAAGELDRRAVSGLAGGWVGRPRGRCRDAGRQARRGPERLGVDARGVDAHRRQTGADLVHERCRPAEVCLGVARWLELGEQRRGETARAVEVAAFEVVRARDGCSRRGCGRSGARRGARGPRRRRSGRGCCARRAATRSPGRNAPRASAWSMARTGVAPMPALISSTGASRPVEDEGAARCRDVELVADARAGCADSRWRRRRVRA